ncbi:MAG TPA: response regulator transcription factor [Actinomycetota bacterium]|nr:response regulator transcription factor [Actinomycetota bacterium]
MEPIRVLAVEEVASHTQELVRALRRRSSVQVLGPVPDDSAAIETLAGSSIDVVVVQLDRRDGRGVAIVSAIRDARDVRVMAATRHAASPLVELALAAGACGVLPPSREPTQLLVAIRRALAGELVLPVSELPTLADRVWQARARRSEHASLGTLTGREKEILSALTDGATTAEIAADLGISRATVQSHVKNVLGKLGVHSKVEAVGTAWRARPTLGSRSA